MNMTGSINVVCVCYRSVLLLPGVLVVYVEQNNRNQPRKSKICCYLYKDIKKNSTATVLQFINVEIMCTYWYRFQQLQTACALSRGQLLK